MMMKKQIASIILAAFACTGFAQGLVKFANSSTTLVYSGYDPISGTAGHYYFALLCAPPGTTDPTQFVFTGLYATNSVSGRFNGGPNTGARCNSTWPEATTRSFFVAGWSADLGHDWNPCWLLNNFDCATSLSFGSSSVGTGRSGGVDPATGETVPALVLFGAAPSITTGFVIGLPLELPPPVNHPTIVTQPTNETALIGSTVDFQVDACSTCGQITFQWFRNGETISGATNSFLQLENVQASQNGGQYFVLVTDQRGSIGSDVATLSVTPAPPVVLASPVSQTAEVGATVRLRVRASGSPPLAYQWFFNDTAMADATNSLLELAGILPVQSGDYRVIVTNVAARAISGMAQVSVINPVPRRMVPALTLGGQIGNRLDIQYCETLSDPQSWVTLDTVTVTNSSQRYFDQAALSEHRLYRARQVNGATQPPALDLCMVTAITLSGTTGSSVRVDGINQFGPTNAWFTLSTVSLTEPVQPYFDTAAIGQPPRLYRVVTQP